MTDRAMVQFTDTGDVSLKGYEDDAESTAESALIEIIGDLSAADAGTQSIHVRDANPADDLGVYTNGPGVDLVTPDDPTFLASVPADKADQYNNWYAFKNDADMEDKTAVLFGFQYIPTSVAPNQANAAGECPVAQVRVDTENAGRIGSYDLTSIDEADQGVLLIEDPLEVKKDDFFLEAYIAAGYADVDFELRPLIKVAEQPSALGQSSAFVNTN